VHSASFGAVSRAVLSLLAAVVVPAAGCASVETSARVDAAAGSESQPLFTWHASKPPSGILFFVAGPPDAENANPVRDAFRWEPRRGRVQRLSRSGLVDAIAARPGCLVASAAQRLGSEIVQMSARSINRFPRDRIDEGFSPALGAKRRLAYIQYREANGRGRSVALVRNRASERAEKAVSRGAVEVAFAPDGRLLVLQQRGRQSRLLTLRNRRRISTRTLPGRPYELLAARTGKVAAVGSHRVTLIGRRNAASLSTAKWIPLTWKPNGSSLLGFERGGSRLGLIRPDGGVRATGAVRPDTVIYGAAWIRSDTSHRNC
jgi:hypothetical protein